MTHLIPLSRKIAACLAALGAAAIAALIALATPAAAQQGLGSEVEATRHNLTASGPGPIKTTFTGESCIFCHTPHASNPVAPLWNRQDPGSFYLTYESSTLVADVGQPTGSSRLCLSCHDGTIALGQTFNSANIGGGSIHISASDRGFLGTDLRDDHPVSFTYDASVATRKGELSDPASLPQALPLDHNRQMQCATCHDPHDDSLGQFLRMSNVESNLCRACHQLSDYASSAHATSNASLAAATHEKWENLNVSTVRQAGCESCHRPHAAGGMQRLLRHEPEEDNCLNCHDGGVAAKNLKAVFNKISAHPVSLATGSHDPTEDPQTMAKHVECVDCHDPHRSGAGVGGGAPRVQPAMYGASGVSSSGLKLDQAVYEYQVCYKCHASRNFATPVVSRYLGDQNIAREFSSSNQSYHPVESQGRSTDVPSLLQDYNTTSIIYCSTCHGSNDPNGPQGPHGSQFRPLLVANYDTRDNVGESPQAFALCYSCHSRSSILGDQSFNGHRKHIVEYRAACATCHDPHGVQQNTHLINFDRSVVTRSPTAGTGPIFNDRGFRTGSCTLSCHGADHNDMRYPEQNVE